MGRVPAWRIWVVAPALLWVPAPAYAAQAKSAAVRAAPGATASLAAARRYLQADDLERADGKLEGGARDQSRIGRGLLPARRCCRAAQGSAACRRAVRRRDSLRAGNGGSARSARLRARSARRYTRGAHRVRPCRAARARALRCAVSPRGDPLVDEGSPGRAVRAAGGGGAPAARMPKPATISASHSKPLDNRRRRCSTFERRSD